MSDERNCNNCGHTRPKKQGREGTTCDYKCGHRMVHWIPIQQTKDVAGKNGVTLLHQKYLLKKRDTESLN